MSIIEKKYPVSYREPWDEIKDADIILYWEAPCTASGKDAEHYLKVRFNELPKILLFAGGPIRPADCLGFDLFLVESKINEENFTEISLPWKRAFGVNTEIMKPEPQPKVWDGCMPATCASWKRQTLFSQALGKKGVLCGRDQETDPIGFINARKYSTLLFPELPAEAVNTIYNSSWCTVNTSDYWGGGQRCTLESLAAGVPVVVMADSPKNREFIEDGGPGLICNPDPESIHRAVENIKTWDMKEVSARARAYVESKWTAAHYAKNIEDAILQVCR